jgi:hypothetical protein
VARAPSPAKPLATDVTVIADKTVCEVRAIRGLNFRKGENELQFKIKEQDYFLAFVEQEKRWYVFAPTSEGVNRIPVYVDAEKYQTPGILETETHLSF